MKTHVMLTASAVLVLTACGGSKFSGPDDVAKQLGCTHVKHAQDVGSSGSVTCTFHGDHVIVSWFDSPQHETAFKDVGKQMVGEGVSKPIIYGHRWAIWCTRPAACEAAKKAMS